MNRPKSTVNSQASYGDDRFAKCFIKRTTGNVENCFSNSLSSIVSLVDNGTQTRQCIFYNELRYGFNSLRLPCLQVEHTNLIH